MIRHPWQPEPIRHPTVAVVSRFVVVALVAAAGITSWTTAVNVRPSAAVLIPRLSVSPSSVRPGDSVTVSAYDLHALADYQVLVCGNAGFGSASDCNLASTTSAATSEAGHFVVAMVVLRPPVPCPCVIKAIPLTGSEGINGEAEISTPITIVGAQTATPVPLPVATNPSGLVVDRAELAGTASWAEFFGGSAHRTLLLTLRDAGANVIPSTPFVLRAGPDANPTEIVSSPVVPPLHPGQVVSYRVPVTFPFLAHGTYVVAGTLGNSGQIVTFKATTPLMPWGLVIVVGLLILVVLGLLVRRFVRWRRGRSGGETSVETPTDRPVGGAAEPVTDGDAIEATPAAVASSSSSEAPSTP